MTAEIPRRICQDRWTPAERAIHDAMQAVEAVGADVRLTRAVMALADAQAWVADYVDGVPESEHYPRPAPSPASAPAPQPDLAWSMKTLLDQCDNERERSLVRDAYSAGRAASAPAPQTEWVGDITADGASTAPGAPPEVLGMPVRVDPSLPRAVEFLLEPSPSRSEGARCQRTEPFDASNRCELAAGHPGWHRAGQAGWGPDGFDAPAPPTENQETSR